MCGDTGTSLLSLRGGFEQEFSHPARAQALHQIKKRAMLESPVATAVWFATRQVLFDIGRTQYIRNRLKSCQQGRLVSL
jgi:hypothetical protein